MTHHMQMKVSTVLEMLGSKRDSKQLEKMFDMTPNVIRQECEDLITDGRLFIPTQGCNTEDPTGKCNGHSNIKPPTNPSAEHSKGKME